MNVPNGYPIPSQTSLNASSSHSLNQQRSNAHGLGSLGPANPLGSHNQLSPRNPAILGMNLPLSSTQQSQQDALLNPVAAAGSSHATPPSPAAPAGPETPVKRGPGRPKGSTNKNKPPALNPDGTPIPKRPVGRPRKIVDPNAPVKPKNPVGRPRKHPLPVTQAASDTSTAQQQSAPAQTLPNGHASTSNLGSLDVAFQPTSSQHTQLAAPAPAGAHNTLAPSPTIAPSPTMSGGTWSASDPSGLVYGSTNGQQTRSRQPGLLGHNHAATSTASSAGTNAGGMFHSPQVPSFDIEHIPSSSHYIDSPLSEHPQIQRRTSSSTRGVDSPALRAPPLQRPGSTSLSVTARPSTGPGRNTLNLEYAETATWAAIQQLGYANPRVVFSPAKSRRSDLSALKRIVPSDVLGAYNDHLRELRRETPARCPDTYTILNSFWLPGISPYFRLTTSRLSYSSALSNHRFFFWDPMYLLVGGIHCPNCDTQLVRDGFHGPCPVLNIGDPFYLIGQTYKCGACAKKADNPSATSSNSNNPPPPTNPNPNSGLYLSWDESILRSLPDALAKEFPAHIKPWGAIGNDLFDLIRTSVRSGMEPMQIAEVIKTACKPGAANIAVSEMGIGGNGHMNAMGIGGMDENPLASPITAPSSPELPDKQRIYYRAWHRNGLMPDSLAPPESSPPPHSSRVGRDGGSGPYQDELHLDGTETPRARKVADTTTSGKHKSKDTGSQSQHGNPQQGQGHPPPAQVQHPPSAQGPHSAQPGQHSTPQGQHPTQAQQAPHPTLPVAAVAVGAMPPPIYYVQPGLSGLSAYYPAPPSASGPSSHAPGPHSGNGPHPGNGVHSGPGSGPHPGSGAHTSGPGPHGNGARSIPLPAVPFFPPPPSTIASSSSSNVGVLHGHPPPPHSAPPSTHPPPPPSSTSSTPAPKQTNSLMGTPTGGAGGASTRSARGAGGRGAVNGAAPAASTSRGGAASASAAGGAMHESLRGTPHDSIRGSAHDSLRGGAHDSLRGRPHDSLRAGAGGGGASGGGGGPPHESLRRANPYADLDEPSPKKRRVRHCAKCGSQTCKGRGGGSNCPNPCRDCGRMDCKGRSSTKPGRMCETIIGGGG